MIQPATLRFIKELTKNNHKDWFNEHRKQYETAKQNFRELVELIIREHSKKDGSLAALSAKDCMFRINRDVRFSKNKAPYKTNFGASIQAGGKKSMLAGYYFHLEPGGKSFVGGGSNVFNALSAFKVSFKLLASFVSIRILNAASHNRSRTTLLAKIECSSSLAIRVVASCIDAWSLVMSVFSYFFK